MGKIILVHANCFNPTASGDYVFAGNIAKDLKIELQGSDIDVYLVSSLDGIGRYEKIYGKASEGRVLVDGISVGLSSLEEFDAVENKVVAFIDANRCKHQATEIVKRVISPDSKFLFVGNVNQRAVSDLFIKTMYELQLRKEQPELYEAFASNDILIGSAGFGADRLGIPTINKTTDLPALTYEQTAQLPTEKYGFMYLASVNSVKDSTIIAQYMKLTGFDNYILVGDFATQKSSIVSAYQLDSSLISTTTSQVPTIFYHNSVPNPIMRRMVANVTGNLVLSTGVTSTIEAMRDEKLTFNQDLSVNERFMISYLLAVKDIATSDVGLIGAMPQLIIELSALLFAPKPLSRAEMIRTRDLLGMSTVCSRLIAVNQTILDRESGKIAPRLLGFISNGRSTQDQVQLAQVCISLRKPGEMGSPVYDTALRRASGLGRLFETKVLIKAMSLQDLTKVDPTYGMDALHFAVKFKQYDCARELLIAGAEVDTQDNEGRTSLHWAVKNADRNMIKLLVENGADVTKTDSHSKKPEECTSDHGVYMFIRHCYEKVNEQSHAGLSRTLSFA